MQDNKFGLTEEQYNAHKGIMGDLAIVQAGDVFGEASWISLRGPAGCSTAGNTVDVKIKMPLMTRKELMEIFDITYNNVKVLINNGSIINTRDVGKIGLYNCDNMDFNLLELVRYGYSLRLRPYRNDKKYVNKYLKISYWMGFNDIEYSFNKVRNLRTLKRYFEPDLIAELGNI